MIESGVENINLNPEIQYRIWNVKPMLLHGVKT